MPNRILQKIPIFLFVFNLMIFNLSFLNAQYTAVENLLEQYSIQNGLDPTDFTDWYLSSEHISNTSQVRHSYIYQRYNGIEVYNSLFSFHEMQTGILLHTNNQFIQNLANKINVTSPSLSHLDALTIFSDNQNYDNSNFPNQISGISGTDQRITFSGGSISEREIKVKLMYYPKSETEVNLVYDFDILEYNTSDWWSVKIDAIDGSILSMVNWTVSCKHDHKTNTENKHSCSEHSCSTLNSKKSPSLNPDSYNVFAAPTESPSHGGRTLVADPADGTASPYGWHDTNAIAGPEYTITRGNNVYAQEDENGNNGTGYSPDGTASLDFDFTIDFNQAPTNNKDAALTNLFYWNNLSHDVWYHYGFDEAAGNFQSNNYGNGGLAGDYVIADGLDGSGLNNANMSVPPDGTSSRMQMFLWSAAISANSTVNSPGQVEGVYQVAAATFGNENYSITEDIVIADDGSANPTEGCNAFTNTSAMNGKIAMIDRGNCEFGTKVLNAENAGAVGAIICNNVAGSIFNMGPGVNGASVTIPSVMMSQEDCDSLKNYLPNPGVNINIDGSNSGIQIDGDFDNGIIVHEYGHGISIRLAGGANNSNCLSNEEQMGEGWSDWFGLMMTIDSGDTKNDLRGIGTYVKGQSNNGAGIRNYPYTADINVNPFTYSDISSVSIPHGVGSVWASMLWDLTWAFIDVYGYDSDLINGTGGNNKLMEIIIEAIKLQPCSPGFIDGRDAILDADLALFDGTNECIIWETFAARGLGASASQGSTNSVNDGSEAFDIPSDCSLQFTKFADVDTITAGGLINYTIKVVNKSNTSHTNLIIEDSIQEYVSYVAGSANMSGSFNVDKIIWPSTTLVGNDSLEYTFQLKVDSSLLGPSYAIFDDVEAGNTLWDLSSKPNLTQVWVEDPLNPYSGATAWFARNVDFANLQELVLIDEVLLTDSSEFKFFHFFDTELEVDGGTISISKDGGGTWDDLGFYINQNPYNSFIFNNPEQPAFSGNNGTYQESIVDLSSYGGEYCKIKFSFYTNQTQGIYGWNVDDISLSNLKIEIRNTASLSSNETETLFANSDPIQILAPNCNDGVQNGEETAIDCGGTICQACNTCPTNETYTGTQASTNYQVSDTIYSTVVVGALDSITYQANCIELNNGFEVVIGGEFLAEIAPCTPLAGGPILQKVLVKYIELIVEDEINIATLDIPEDGYYDITIKKHDGTIVVVVPPNTFMKKGPNIVEYLLGPTVDNFIYNLNSKKRDD